MWLGGGDGYEATVRRFLEGPTAGFAVAELDEPITVGELTGCWLILSLRKLDAGWGDSGKIHVILCASEPRSMVTARSPGVAWVEPHARYRRL